MTVSKRGWWVLGVVKRAAPPLPWAAIIRECYELPISLLFYLILSYLIASYLIYLILSHALQLLVDSGSVAWSPHVSLVYLLT